MPDVKIRLINTFGKSLPFSDVKIKQALIGRRASAEELGGEAHVWAEDPVMVCIWKLRDTKRGPFRFLVTETDEDSRGRLVDIVNIEFKNEEISRAIKTFMDLCLEPKKKIQRAIISGLGGSVIFPNR